MEEIKVGSKVRLTWLMGCDTRNGFKVGDEFVVVDKKAIGTDVYVEVNGEQFDMSLSQLELVNPSRKFVIVNHINNSVDYLFDCTDFPNLAVNDVVQCDTSRGSQMAVVKCEPQEYNLESAFTKLLFKRFGVTGNGLKLKKITGKYTLEK